MSLLLPANRTPEPAPARVRPDAALIAQRHVRLGWWLILVFLTLGLVLEGLHAFKLGAYLHVDNATRRFMWTLAHAHGTLLGMVHLGFAFTVRTLSDWPEKNRGIASTCLTGASGLLPAGFFLGGLFFYGGDPGLGVLLVPTGGLLLFIAVLLTAHATGPLTSTGRRAGGKQK